MTKFTLLLAACAVASPALAQESGSYDVNEIVIEDYLGTVDIVTRAGAVEASLDFGSDDEAPRASLSQNGDALRVRGDSRSLEDDYNCDTEDSVFGYREDGVLFLNGRFHEFSDANRLTIYAPSSVNVRIENSLVSADMDEVATLIFENDHCAQLSVNRVSETTSLGITGIVDMEIDYTSNFYAEVSGVGAVEVGEVNGAVDIDFSGVGGVDIRSGTATSFKADMSGVGDLDFGGHAVNPDVDASGIGSVDIASYEGTFRRDRSGIGSVDARCTARCNGTR